MVGTITAVGSLGPQPRPSSERILLTGGCGFIGSTLVRRLIWQYGARVLNCDKLTYAAVPGALQELEGHPAYDFQQVDVCNRRRVQQIFRDYRPTGVIHCAAETHVDRSIDGPLTFVRTNVLGTSVLLDVSLDYYRALQAEERACFRFHQVSTDEVFGSLASEGAGFGEGDPYAPNSPYSASKAGADHLVRAWFRTFALPVVTSHGSNTFGPWQFPEKFIPVMIINALKGRPMPVYGRGENVRDWLFVEDHAEAIWEVWSRGLAGGTYNVGGGTEMTNRQVATRICRILNRLLPDSPYRPHEQLITFVADRPGHDFRYALDTRKIRNELGWRPRCTFDEALERCVSWYVDHRDWWETILANNRSVGLRAANRRCDYDGVDKEGHSSSGR